MRREKGGMGVEVQLKVMARVDTTTGSTLDSLLLVSGVAKNGHVRSANDADLARCKGYADAVHEAHDRVANLQSRNTVAHGP